MLKEPHLPVLSCIRTHLPAESQSPAVQTCMGHITVSYLTNEHLFV